LWDVLLGLIQKKQILELFKWEIILFRDNKKKITNDVMQAIAATAS
jgi:hypothetical protein